MPKALSDSKRAAILASVRTADTDGKSVRQIARDHDVAPSTVTRLAAENGITDAFARSKTKEATHAREADCKALRARLKLDLLGDAQRFRERAWSPYEVVVSTPVGAETITLDLPPLTEARAAYTAIGIAIDKSVRLEQVDAEGGEGIAAVDEWLRGMMGETR